MITRLRLPLMGGVATALLLAGGAAAAPRVQMTSPHALYLLRCSGCHAPQGGGAPAAGIPPFQSSIGPMAADREGRWYMMSVPGVAGSGLDAGQKAAVMNYVLERWGDGSSKPVPFTAAEVERLTASQPTDVVELRRRIVAKLKKVGVTLAEYPWP